MHGTSWQAVESGPGLRTDIKCSAADDDSCSFFAHSSTSDPSLPSSNLPAMMAQVTSIMTALQALQQEISEMRRQRRSSVGERPRPRPMGHTDEIIGVNRALNKSTLGQRSRMSMLLLCLATVASAHSLGLVRLNHGIM